MSLPPAHVQIKRKRDTAEPPETLHIENSHRTKQRRTSLNFVDVGSDVWVFQKVKQDAIKENTPIEENPPIKPPIIESHPWEQKAPEIKATQPGDELRGDSPLRRPPKYSAVNFDPPKQMSLVLPENTTSQPIRRFHLTRVSRVKNQPPINGVRKRRAEKAVATFKERRPPSKTEAALAGQESDTIKLHMPSNNPEAKLDTPSSISNNPVQTDNGDELETCVPTSTPNKPQKKPGRNAGRGLRQAPSLAGKANFGFGSEALAAEMQKFSLETMALDTTKQDSMPTTSTANTLAHKPDLKFKPKAPAKRYHERHPEVSQSILPEPDDTMDTDDESDYVTDTYVRVPAHTLQTMPTDMGVLVIENDEEMQEFYDYGNDSSDDSDIFDDEVDENAEANPNNEYPDEEVASDDEFDLNSYRYRVNASDDEEYDLDETSFSDNDEWDVNPWTRKPKPSKKSLWDDDEDDEMSDS